MTSRTVLVALLAAALCAVGASSAAAAPRGSILYVKKGKLWVSSPDGKRDKRVPHRGRFLKPSQADNGTIVAQRGTRLHRMNRRGKPLNKPITTAFRTNPVLPAYKGPLWPEVSPDGKTIAYTYSWTASRFDPACTCFLTTPSLNTAYTSASRLTDDPVAGYGNATMYAHASWIDNRRTLLTTPELYDFGGDVLDTVAVDTLGGGQDSYQRWFSQCTGCGDIQTLQLYPLDEGEMTRQGDKLVFTSGEVGTKTPGSRLAIYRLGVKPPSTAFEDPCFAHGDFNSPSWSPDGKSLAWADKHGVWVGKVGAIAPGATCELSRKLIARGGSQPDWGPARP
jgi:hypothetical protein